MKALLQALGVLVGVTVFVIAWGAWLEPEPLPPAFGQ